MYKGLSINLKILKNLSLNKLRQKRENKLKFYGYFLTDATEPFNNGANLKTYRCMIAWSTLTPLIAISSSISL